MNSVFNTYFETSLRILLLLSSTDNEMTMEKIVFLDFITVYGSSFDVASENLNGDNSFMYSELAARKKNVTGAIKELVTQGFIEAIKGMHEFKYRITELGATTTAKFESRYASKYRISAKKVCQKFGNRPEQEINMLIYDKAASSLKGEL
ncbi:DNA-binding MarR family transcriptional regulator [Lachnospiraceae bacterium PFB1-21]